MMKTRNYYRPSTVSLGKKKRVVRRKVGTRFFLKIFLLISFAAFVLAGGWGLWYSYRLFTQTDLSDWHVKEVEVVGLSDPLHASVLAAVQPYQNTPFPAEKSNLLRNKLAVQFPMLKNIRVKRKLLHGKLLVSAARRVPLVRLQREDDAVRYADADGILYTDTAPENSTALPILRLEGKMPEKLEGSLAQWISTLAQLHNGLDYRLIVFNTADNTLQLHLADQSVINFGPAVALQQKAARAAQIRALAKEKYPGPFVLDFRFFENGKVFLAQQAR